MLVTGDDSGGYVVWIAKATEKFVLLWIFWANMNEVKSHQIYLATQSCSKHVLPLSTSEGTHMYVKVTL